MSFEFEKKKLYAFLGQRLLSELKGQKAYIAGGMVTSLFCNREIKDIDIYFKSEKAFVDFIGSVWGGGWIVAHTNKATLIKFKSEKEIQLIHFKYFPTAEDIFKTFDFTACMGAFDFESEEFILHPEFMQHNSQRILKFNPKTAFPIVSLLRVQKYNGKGYTISKPEFLRIALTCMNLEIDTYDELKEQLGGMYGVNYDKLFKDCDGKVDLLEAVDKIKDLVLDDDYFKTPEVMGTEMGDLDEFLDDLVASGVPYIEIGNDIYRVFNGRLKKSNSAPKNGERLDKDAFLKNKKYYKFVEKKDDKYVSYYDSKFEYVIGEVAVGKGQMYNTKTPVLFFNDLSRISKSPYKSSNNRALIEVEIINAEDFVSLDSDSVKLHKCRVLREVPVEEYKLYLESRYDDDWL